MKKLFNYLFFILFCGTSLSFNAQSKSAAVLSVYTQSAKISPEMAESVLRVEMTKTEQFNVIDKLDMIEILEENKIDVSNCYGKKCLLSVGKSAGVDKVITGSIENLGKKIVVTVKILDVASESYDKVAIEEFINLDSEIQSMVKIVVNKALGIENSQEILNTLVYFNQPPMTPTTYIKNNGPRMGLSYVIGNTGRILSAEEINGGWGHKNPVVMSQLGYQFEGSYLSAGDFQALVEGMIFINGIEKEMFSPSFALLNGFRSSKNGWEFGFGPTFRLTKMAKGYYIGDTLGGSDYDVVTDWRLASDWNGPGQNPYPSKDRTDARGTTRLKTGWVWAIGRTFHSGYLNIPVNLFYSSGKDGGYIGLSMGFNIAKKN
jgi:TolB-like protein